MSSVSEIISKSLKDKYKQEVVEEGMNIDISSLGDNDKIITEDIINNLSSALAVGIVANDIIADSKEKRKSKK